MRLVCDQAAGIGALVGFTLPGDISASNRYFHHDIVTTPAVLDAGHIVVPTGAGIGVDVDREALDAVTVERVEVRR